MTAVRRLIGLPVTLLIAVMVQVAVVNRAPLPGETGPDVVLLVVTALGAMLGPMTGLVAGFCGGLAVDIAPPVGHLAGEYALVFCLAGYACGRLRDFADPMEEHGTITTVTAMAIGAAGGEAMKAALGLMLSDPDAAGPVVKHVLPGAILYDLLLIPFVLWLTAMAVGRPARPNAPDPHRTRPRTAAQYGAVRVASAGSAPRLRLSGAPTAAARAPARREPRLRLAGGTSPALSRTGGGVSSSSLSPGGRRAVPVNFSGSSRSLIGAGRPGGSGSGKYGLTGGGGLLGGGLFGGGMFGFGGGSVFSGDGSLGSALGPSLYSGSPLRGAGGLGKGWLRARKPAGGPGRALAGKGPGKGWLRSSSGPGASALRSAPGPRTSPGKGWLRPAKPAKKARRSSPGRGWLKAGKPAPAWRPKSPSRGWLNGSGALGRGNGLGSGGLGGRGLGGRGLGGRRLGSRGIGGSGIKGGSRSGIGAASAYRRRRGLRIGGRR